MSTSWPHSTQLHIAVVHICMTHDCISLRFAVHIRGTFPIVQWCACVLCSGSCVVRGWRGLPPLPYQPVVAHSVRCGKPTPSQHPNQHPPPLLCLRGVGVTLRVGTELVPLSHTGYCSPYVGDVYGVLGYYCLALPQRQPRGGVLELGSTFSVYVVFSN